MFPECLLTWSRSLQCLHAVLLPVTDTASRLLKGALFTKQKLELDLIYYTTLSGQLLKLKVDILTGGVTSPSGHERNCSSSVSASVVHLDFTQNPFAPRTLCDGMMWTSWAVQEMCLGSGSS